MTGVTVSLGVRPEMTSLKNASNSETSDGSSDVEIAGAAVGAGVAPGGDCASARTPAHAQHAITTAVRTVNGFISARFVFDPSDVLRVPVGAADRNSCIAGPH